MKNWDFWVTLSFIFCRIGSLSGRCRRGGANLWWNCQFSSKEMFIFMMQQFGISLSNGNTKLSKLVNKAKIWKIFLGLIPRPAVVFGRNHTCLPGPCFAQFFLMGNNIFPLFYQCRLFYFRDKPWICILVFVVYRYVSVVAFVQYFITNTVVLAY